MLFRWNNLFSCIMDLASAVPDQSLRGEENIPPRLALRYRTQEHDESLGEFAMSLGKSMCIVYGGFNDIEYIHDDRLLSCSTFLQLMAARKLSI